MVVAVLTADIVNSTQLAPKAANALRNALAQLLDGLQFEFFRGDSLQVLFPQPEQALRYALQARSIARGLGPEHDIRCSIGIGAVDTPVKKLATASGEAFLLSGRAFDTLADNRRLLLVDANEAHNRALRILAAYCDHIFRSLTARQALVVYQLLAGKTQTEIATQLQVTQATISNHAQSAAWSELENLLREYEALCTDKN